MEAEFLQRLMSGRSRIAHIDHTTPSSPKA
jgi:hypothetical protein